MAASSRRARLIDGPSSETGRLLLDHFVHGQASGRAVQELAAAAQRDMGAMCPTDVRSFSSLGAAGARASHIERDLHRWLTGTFRVPIELSSVPLTVKDTMTHEERTVDYPVIWPHMWAAACYEIGGGAFQKCVIGAGGRDDLMNFWSRAWRTAWGRAHPVYESGEDLSCVVPVRFHGDAARYQKRLSSPNRVLILSTMSAMVSGCSWDTRWLFTLIDTRIMVKGKTLSQLLEFYRKGLAQLFTGLWPAMNLADGSPWPRGGLSWNRRNQRLAGAFCFAFAGLKGDLEWRRDAMFEHRNYGANRCCPKCLASKNAGETFYGDVRETAGWRSTLIGTASYLDNMRRRSPIVDLPGWHVDLTLWDLMHNLYIGVGRDAAASAIVLLVELGYWQGGVDCSLVSASQAFRVWCKANHVKPPGKSFTRNSLSWANNQQQPHLEFKAAHTKLVMRWLADELREASVCGDHEVRVAAICFYELTSFVHVLDQAGLWLQEWEIDKAQRHGQEFLNAYTDLVLWRIEHDICRWHIRPKLHYLAHQILQLCDGQNPKHFSCFMDEDFVGKVSRLCAACRPAQVGHRGLSRYLLLLCSRWRSNKQQRVCECVLSHRTHIADASPCLE